MNSVDAYVEKTRKEAATASVVIFILAIATLIFIDATLVVTMIS